MGPSIFTPASESSAVKLYNNRLLYFTPGLNDFVFTLEKKKKTLNTPSVTTQVFYQEEVYPVTFLVGSLLFLPGNLTFQTFLQIPHPPGRSSGTPEGTIEI